MAEPGSPPTWMPLSRADTIKASSRSNTPSKADSDPDSLDRSHEPLLQHQHQRQQQQQQQQQQAFPQRGSSLIENHHHKLDHEHDPRGPDQGNDQDTDQDIDDDRLTRLAGPFTPRSSVGGTPKRIAQAQAQAQARHRLSKRCSDLSLRSHASNGSLVLAPTVDREGNTISSIDGLPLDLLQSLYLSQSAIQASADSDYGHDPGPSTPVLQLDYDHPSTAPMLHSSGGSSTAYGGHHSRQSSGASFRSVSFTQRSTFPPVRRLAQKDRRRVLVTGGAGFVGSHLVDRLMCSGHDVVVLDNFFSGSKTSISHWVGHPNFELVRADVTEPFMVEVDQIYHLACPASPKAYQANAVKTLKTNFLGTFNMLGLAKRVKARFLLSSTSEIYGSPEQHPQQETYWGHVNPVGPRACYDEGKRVAEALTYGYHRQDGVDVRVARIFNCYGPRMNMDDGRLVSNFIVAALKGEPIRIYGDGTATRSLMFVHDLVSGLIALMASTFVEPVNIGSEDEATVAEWAHVIRDTVHKMRKDGEIPRRSNLSRREDEYEAYYSPSLREGNEKRLSLTDGRQLAETSVIGRAQVDEDEMSEIIYEAAVVDDPPRRRPDISRARQELGWQPRWTTVAGIRECILYFANELEGEY
ncbi:BZ3500_MvSof-1268-A1-R1_Chr8-1g09796 [Microbotryum saponariae]|uniref:UDP-glucuronic acid decarboxylase 1 n=1 Tax=Microbotryum saponariae TaxID=289078 RepID=A0A2X0MUM1_9BASI|nr:BZ3500_MvSof-1268-A1-R1_Chr8-1g09796 [Microbotryum saponariae]SDA08082.1 BZ3501_MvSof-1269-A2-R1_Chr8-1g09519 [Microbotryum saponariae]